MKVTNAPSHTGVTPQNTIDKAQGTDKANPAKNGEGKASAASQGASHIEISEDAKLMQQARDIVKNLPESTSSERVAALKQSVRAGTYNVDAGTIADRLLEEHLGSHFGKNSL